MIAAATGDGGGWILLLLVGFAGGLIVGWNFLPQPKWLAKRFKS